MTEAAGRSPFGDRVARAVVTRRSQLVLGLDPDPARLWPRAAELADAAGGSPSGAAGGFPSDAAGGSPSGAPGGFPPDPSGRAARAVAAHCALALEATADQCVAVKLQVGCFERLGAPGWSALAGVAERARDHGLLVIADAKRGDIDVSAAAYGQAFFGVTPTPFGPIPSLAADALTVNPLLGMDSIVPFLERARGSGAGLFVLVRTSNPGAGDVQDLELAGGGTVSERLADMVDRLAAGGIGESGLSDVGAVVGATAPERLEALRERMPRTIFLLPGVGAQGGAVERLGFAFGPGPAGGLISASRGIVGAHEQLGGDPAVAARREATRLRELIWELAT